MVSNTFWLLRVVLVWVWIQQMTFSFPGCCNLSHLSMKVECTNQSCIGEFVSQTILLSSVMCFVVWSCVLLLFAIAVVCCCLSMSVLWKWNDRATYYYNASCRCWLAAFRNPNWLPVSYPTIWIAVWPSVSLWTSDLSVWIAVWSLVSFWTCEVVICHCAALLLAMYVFLEGCVWSMLSTCSNFYSPFRRQICSIF